MTDATATPTPGPALDECGARAVLGAASGALRARRLAEVAEMEIAAQWAVLHGHPDPGREGRDPMVQPGGDGTPEVREHALPELAMARETHQATTRALVADTLDLVHRLPRVWAVVRAGECEPWVARKVATQSRHLSQDRVALVDRAVARMIRGHAPATVLQAAAARIIEADPESHAMRREIERRRRYVTLSRSDEYGYRTIIARITAGDAAWIDAMVDRVADILVAEHGHDHHRDELRSRALGWLARPADLLRLLLDHTFPADDPGEPEEPDGEPSRPVWQTEHLDRTLGRLAALSVRQLAALRGKGTVYVHLAESALRRQAGLARVEGDGPMLVQALSELLGHADVRLMPVLDLHLTGRGDAYEHPEPVKDQVWLTAGGDAFPFSPATATRAAVDFDHAVPYLPPDRGGPPGQTGTHNSAPLRRRHHRWKTHGGYRVRPAGPGRYVWQTPHGLCLLRDHHGTRRLTDGEAELILTAPPGVDIYPGVELAYEPA
ncbi:DUF222 domain-containing protein [Nocardioides dongkuii]|uniref:DUF222 domain-containing protein n=1 Tax=Nocardioides dongkuii TaxID=2760089 RepID=UPI0015FB4C16|nr:hypothetical protein [Nocardioides dongkuii]